MRVLGDKWVGFRVSGFGFQMLNWGSGFGFRVSDVELGFRDSDYVSAWCLGLRVAVSGLGVMA